MAKRKAKDGNPEPIPRGRRGKGPRALRDAPTKSPGKVPTGRRLTAAEQGLRDAAMVEARVRGDTWAEISKKYGISTTGARNAVKARREAMPDLMTMDSTELVEEIIFGWQISIGNYERMALELFETNPGAAVAAKRGADEARKQLTNLLQATGKLPRELGTLRYHFEVQTLAITIQENLDGFQKQVAAGVEQLDLPKAKMTRLRKLIEEARAPLNTHLKEYAGTAREVT